MRTLGVDLAAQDKDTAICAVEWRGGRAIVEEPVVGPDDAAILAEMRRAQAVGIDAPFGWPQAMVDAVSGWADGERWPSDADPTLLRHRETDRFVHEVIASKRGLSVWPLSVSSDRIAVCAWRCARILSEFGNGPADDVFEVYPAGALAIWALPHKGYKTNSSAQATTARTKREQILQALEASAGWLVMPDAARERCLANDDAFDALICTLVARAAASRRTLEQPPEVRDAAAREGWIELPLPDSLASLNA